jgi:hypothetical protein
VNRRLAAIALGLFGLGSLAGFGLKTVLASGIPDTTPLYYSGTLTENGQLVNGQRAITVILWPDATTVGTPLCQTVASTTQVVSGRFRIALASPCKAVFNQYNNAWVEVVEGATSLGRAKVGAVPYAIEADHATSATNATNAANASDDGGIQQSLAALQSSVDALMSRLDLKVFAKGGNNGSAPCDAFCAGSQWGPVGTCVGAKFNGTYVACSTVASPTGMAAGTCWCSAP